MAKIWDARHRLYDLYFSNDVVNRRGRAGPATNRHNFARLVWSTRRFLCRFLCRFLTAMLTTVLVWDMCGCPWLPSIYWSLACVYSSWSRLPLQVRTGIFSQGIVHISWTFTDARFDLRTNRTNRGLEGGFGWVKTIRRQTGVRSRDTGPARTTALSGFFVHFFTTFTCSMCVCLKARIVSWFVWASSADVLTGGACRASGVLNCLIARLFTWLLGGSALPSSCGTLWQCRTSRSVADLHLSDLVNASVCTFLIVCLFTNDLNTNHSWLGTRSLLADLTWGWSLGEKATSILCPWKTYNKQWGKDPQGTRNSNLWSCPMRMVYCNSTEEG